VNLFVFGLGYTALHFVRRHEGRFDRIAGTVRSREKAAALGGARLEARVFSADERDRRIGADIAAADVLLSSIPPQDGRDPVLDAFEADIAAASRLAWIGYLSTIGVYGDHAGAWVDESTPPSAPDGRSRARLAAEAAWLDLGTRAGKAAHVFRLGGIYGPQRNALAQLAAGTARRLVKPGQVFNRIHVDDIAAVLMASLERPDPGTIYNVVDDEPSPPQDVIAYAADLAGIVPPPEIPHEQVDLSPIAASFYAENRRVRNERVKRRLGVSLRYPTYREGLRALREAGEGP
jgi:nucleoside-diphosphate-sugar epimerase